MTVTALLGTADVGWGGVPVVAVLAGWSSDRVLVRVRDRWGVPGVSGVWGVGVGGGAGAGAGAGL